MKYSILLASFAGRRIIESWAHMTLGTPIQRITKADQRKTSQVKAGQVRLTELPKTVISIIEAS